MSRKLPVGDGVDVILADVKMVSPALDSNPDSVLFVSVPMPGIRTFTDHKGNQSQKGDMILATISDKRFEKGRWGKGREIFEATDEAFISRGLLARIPAPIMEQRWSAKSIEQYLEGKEPQVSPWEVFIAIKEKFDYYIDFADSKYGPTVSSIYILGSYLFFLFEYFPYLKLGGEKGSGKTKTGTIFAALGFNGHLSANSTKAVIYRFAQDTRGLMVIDEGENLMHKSEEQIAYYQVLNSGWERNGFAILSDKETLRPTKWSTYCLKIICSIGGLEEVLGDRAFEIILLRTLNKLKADREASLASGEWQPIRDSLYLFTFQHWREIQPLVDSTSNDFDFVGRVWNLAKPLLVIAKLVDKYRPKGEASIEEEIRAFIGDQAREKAAKATESFAATVLNAVETLFLKESGKGTLDEISDAERRISVTDVTKWVKEAEGLEKLSSRRVATTIRNLGIYRDPKRDSPTGGNRFSLTKSELESAKSRVLGGIAELTELTEELKNTEHTEHTEGTEGKSDPHASPGEAQKIAGGSEISSVASAPSASSGICELCGKTDSLTRTSDGIYVCAKCLRESEP